MHHAIAGYEMMTRKGESEIARICITHSFPRMRVDDAASELDMTDGELEFMKNFLSARPADDYDRLIQLCDSISLPEGVCLMEKRLVDVALRHGVGGNTISKWKAFLSLRDDVFKPRRRQHLSAFFGSNYGNIWKLTGEISIRIQVYAYV